MSTKFPSSALLTELSVFLKKLKIKALVEWAPRESNWEAAALANGVTDGFNPELEMKVDVAKLRCLILPDALKAGRQAEESFRMAKERAQLPNRATKERRKKLEDRLRTKDPW